MCLRWVNAQTPVLLSLPRHIYLFLLANLSPSESYAWRSHQSKTKTKCHSSALYMHRIMPTKILSVWSKWKRLYVWKLRSIPFRLINFPPFFQIRSDKANSFTRIFYYLSGPGVDKDPKNVFYVERETGHVKINSILDREEIPFYRVKAYMYIQRIHTYYFKLYHMGIFKKKKLMKLPYSPATYIVVKRHSKIYQRQYGWEDDWPQHNRSGWERLHTGH